MHNHFSSAPSDAHILETLSLWLHLLGNRLRKRICGSLSTSIFVSPHLYLYLCAQLSLNISTAVYVPSLLLMMSIIYMNFICFSYLAWRFQKCRCFKKDNERWIVHCMCTGYGVKRGSKAVVNAKVWKQSLEKVLKSKKIYINTQNGLHFSFFFFSRLPEIREPKLEWDYRDRNRMRHGGAIAHLQQRFPKLGDLLDQISSLLNRI